MRKFKRVFLIVMDSFGAGNAKDAEEYGDQGADTMGHIAESVENWKIPNLQKLGLANLHPLKGVKPAENPMGYYTVLNEASKGKDTMTGHWELMGIKTTRPFVTFTETGFPPDLIAELERRTGRTIIGNKSSSGTEILEELAEEEIATGHMIVYTSADSVLQICGNEETFGLDELYRCCEIARELTLKDEWRVGRVIARPYVGKKRGELKRTSNRRDYALSPTGKTVLDALKEQGLSVISIGKISDIFNGEGITEAYHSDSSVHGMEQTKDLVANKDFEGLCFVNLVDFDALWGHRRNPDGYAKETERFDEKLGEVLEFLKEDDLLMITADHGNDPTYKGTDHTREQVPLLIYAKGLEGSGRLEETDSFGTVGASIAENFGIAMPKGTIGTSILVTEAYHSDSSVHGMEQTKDLVANKDFEGLCFVNLVDFDALWGHRRNPDGYAKETERFDEKLGEVLEFLKEDDLLMITADHGNDPTYKGTDHTREQVPLLIYAKGLEGSGRLEETDSFGTVGASIAENFGIAMPKGTIGTSILGQVK